MRIDESVAECIATNVKKLFRSNGAKCMYYVIWCVCNMGANEAKRRKDTNDIGVCIAAIDSHFVTAREKDQVLEMILGG